MTATAASRNRWHIQAVAFVLWWPVFSFLEAFSTTTTILVSHRRKNQGKGDASFDRRKSILVIDPWMIDDIMLCHRSRQTTIHMGKGFNRARNKQAELAKKMAAAKSQKQAAVPGSDTTTNGREHNKDSTSDENEGRDDFEALLRTTKGAIPSGFDTESAYIVPIEAGSKTKPKNILPQTPKKPRKSKKNTNDRTVRTQAISEAKRKHFESLIDASTSAPLGPIGAVKLVPWVPPFLKKGLVVFVDPRSNSNDLRRAIDYHASSSLTLSSSELDIAFVTADSLGETKAWLKRNEIVLAGSNSEERLQILCDPGWSFMTTYEIVGDSIDRQWSMTMLAFDTKGDLIRLDRDVEPSRCGDLVASVMKDVGASS